MAFESEYNPGENAQKEDAQLQKWRERNIFAKTLAKKSPEGEFIFYEGPPTANGRPGIHHLISRAFKDVIPRYKTMRGFHVRRKGGWDTHGLPVEIETEKILGLKSKKEIEEYGIAAFNEKCKESVWKYMNEWRAFTERMGYWVNLDDAYVTYYPSYIESVWNVIKEVDRQKLLYQDYKVLPWCPRCGTALSSHEIAQGYQDIKDLSVYVKFKLDAESTRKLCGQDAENVYFLAWTTTPWTLPGNVALAVGEDIEYDIEELSQKVDSAPETERHLKETIIFARDLRDKILSQYADNVSKSVVEGQTTRRTIKGKELVGLSYEPLFPYLNNIAPDSEKPKLEKAYKVYAADFVTTTDGTGIVHTAVMYGQDDFVLGTEIGLPKVHLVDETGHFIKGTGELEGLPVKDKEDNGLATAIVVLKYLQDKGFFFKKESHAHTYPFCWRCKTPLIYYARTSWYIGMSQLRDTLVKENEKINWVPEHIRGGRFGEWLREVKDWAVSRDRYWGTPLPVWTCEHCKHREVVGSIADLTALAQGTTNAYTVMRHGEALSNAENIASSKKGSKFDVLTEEGKRQVVHAAKKIEKIDLILASPYGRTTETAEIIAQEHGLKEDQIIFDDRLGELKLGKLDGRTFHELAMFFTDGDWFTKRPEGGESHEDIKRRVTEFLYETEDMYDGKNILIVTHGAPAQMLFAASEQATATTIVKDIKMFKETAEVHELPFIPLPHNEKFELDLHKPYIDEYVVGCPKCSMYMKRTPEVLDAWLDSGSMPFAQDHYPFENKKWVEKEGYPADYICEGIDQTRGWFYTLHAVGVLMGRGRAFENVICLTHILDAEGKKMSKSLGNVVNPWEMISKYGVDALRFWMFAVNQPGDSKNFDERTVDEGVKKVFTVLRNVVKFYQLYAHDASHESQVISHEKSKNVLDKWILARLNELITSTTEHFENYRTYEPARDIRDFINDLSTWYVRRSRDRFKDEGEDKLFALSTTRYVVLELSKLMAPMTPFFAEELYENMHGPLESVHLEAWPEAKKVDADLLEHMAEARRTVSLALEARMNAGVKIRQPLQRLTIRNPKSEIRKIDDILNIIKDEVNVKEIAFTDGTGWEVELDTHITPGLKKEGDLRDLIRALQDFRKTTNLTPSDKVHVVMTAIQETTALAEEYKDQICAATNLSDMTIAVGDAGSEPLTFKLL
ncbi:MAG: class I tRNA ligase family protein [Patescibacteria group bacterium]